jgi:plastocyanin
MSRRLKIFALLASAFALAFAAAACGGDSGESGPPPPSTFNIKSANLAFDTKTITLPANTEVTIVYANEDAGVLHNVAIYKSSSARDRVFVGELFLGVDTRSYTFKTPGRGTYFFRCDSHPDMNGSVVVS